MLSLRRAPDFRLLEAVADRLTDNDASSLASNRREDPRRSVRGVVAAGVIPGPCERLTLGRIPVSVFKPVWAAWAVDLAVSGMALVADQRVAQAERWWLRLDDFATRPTILPAFVAGCRLLMAEDTGVEGVPLYRIRFKFQVSSKDLHQRLRMDDADDLQPRDRVEEIPRLVESVAA